MLTKEQIDTFRGDFPQGIIHLVGKWPPSQPKDGAPWECVFRAPTRAEYKMYRANCHNPARIADASDNLAVQTVVHPTKEAFQALLEKFPGIPEALCADENLKALTGTVTEEGSKS